MSELNINSENQRSRVPRLLGAVAAGAAALGVANLGLSSNEAVPPTNTVTVVTSMENSNNEVKLLPPLIVVRTQEEADKIKAEQPDTIVRVVPADNQPQPTK